MPTGPKLKNPIKWAFVRHERLPPSRDLKNRLLDDEWYALIDGATSRSQLRSVWAHIDKNNSRYSIHLSNLLIRAFGRRSGIKDALLVYDSMEVKTSYSWILVLSAIAMARWVCHKSNTNALVGHLVDASSCRDDLPGREARPWKVMLAAAIHGGKLDEATETWEKMPEKDSFAWTVMLAANAERGYLFYCWSFFERMPWRDVLAWNLILAVLCRGGEWRNALRHFRLMVLDGVEPDEISFVTLLVGTKFLDYGRLIFSWMIIDHGIQPVSLHYTAVVYLLRKNTRRRDAEKLSKELSIDRDKNWAKLLARKARAELEPRQPLPDLPLDPDRWRKRLSLWNSTHS